MMNKVLQKKRELKLIFKVLLCVVPFLGCMSGGGGPTVTREYDHDRVHVDLSDELDQQYSEVDQLSEESHTDDDESLEEAVSNNYRDLAIASLEMKRLHGAYMPDQLISRILGDMAYADGLDNLNVKIEPTHDGDVVYIETFEHDSETNLFGAAALLFSVATLPVAPVDLVVNGNESMTAGLYRTIGENTQRYKIINRYEYEIKNTLTKTDAYQEHASQLIGDYDFIAGDMVRMLDVENEAILLSDEANQTLILIDLSDYQVKLSRSPIYDEGLRSVSLTSDMKHFGVIKNNGDCVVLDRSLSEVDLQIDLNDSGNIQNFGISRDGEAIASISTDNTLRVVMKTDEYEHYELTKEVNLPFNHESVLHVNFSDALELLALTRDTGEVIFISPFTGENCGSLELDFVPISTRLSSGYLVVRDEQYRYHRWDMYTGLKVNYHFNKIPENVLGNDVVSPLHNWIAKYSPDLDAVIFTSLEKPDHEVKFDMGESDGEYISIVFSGNGQHAIMNFSEKSYVINTDQGIIVDWDGLDETTHVSSLSFLDDNYIRAYVDGNEHIFKIDANRLLSVKAYTPADQEYKLEDNVVSTHNGAVSHDFSHKYALDLRNNRLSFSDSDGESAESLEYEGVIDFNQQRGYKWTGMISKDRKGVLQGREDSVPLQ